jgi:replicative DNA helicase
MGAQYPAPGGDRVPPCNIEAEMSALGCMLQSREAMDHAAEKLTPESFYDPAHRTIFSVMRDLYQAGEVVDPVTVANKLDGAGKLDAVGGAVYLAKLDDSVPTTAHANSYFKIVSDKAVLRDLISTSFIHFSVCYEEDGEVDELLDGAETSIFDIAEKKMKESFVAIRSVVTGVVNKIESLSQNKHYVTGVPTGFYDLNRITSGFQNSDLIVLASRPSMGKTALALNIAEHIAVEHKMPVAVFSLETSADQLAQRILCSRAGMDNQRVRRGFIKKSEWPEIIEAAGDLTEAPIYINDTPALTVLQLRAISRRLKSTNDVRLVIVDYLQLLRGTSKRYENRQQEISDMSRSLKALARELDIPVLVLSQLNREVESREDKRPQLSDLRESGAIEQDADVVLLLSRPDYYDENDRPGVAVLNVAKQRNGPVDKVELVFLKECTRFESVAGADGKQSGDDEFAKFQDE